ncbi:hypothetical protein KC332_g10305 [Hortaea werneckii]|nr:hypothetical protein KC358_g10134 [Hortaea werneckii]KAI6824525.1 hypothetical protein KC350_g8991 [Hortaea werneckii]KAI6916976.1 hypothetical protein KC341_g18793 [Hortaea werneckii]KAI6920379.1 hypothetical protein KC348_g10410 [Hortaea werneckii]KAI6965275.1 hypothetical protein KC321_g10198 [Hortaea werneckii]
MPHYMSAGVNELSAQGIETAINGLMQMLILSITGVEEIVLFVINLLTSTYVCLITLAVGGSLHAAISVAEELGDFLNSTAKDVGKELGDVTEDFDGAMNKFLGGLTDFASVFAGKKLDPPTIDLTDEIKKLDNLQIPSDYDEDLMKLNDSIPTFEQVHNFTNAAIRLPFEEVKKLLNESLPRYTMNCSLFPVPKKERLTFCSDDDGINNFFDDLVTIERSAKKTFLSVLLFAAILVMIPMAWRETRRWKLQKGRAQLVKNDAFDPMDAVYIVSRPYTAGAGLKLSAPIKSSRRRTLVRWAVAYATTTPVLFVLSLAIAGLLGCLCQYILLKSIEKETPKLENQIIGFADKVIHQLNNASQQWAIGTNTIINNTNADINEDVFGWVNTSTNAVNDTLNTFVDGMVDALNTTFEGIQKGLTWVSDHAHVDFPLLPNDTFSLGTTDKVAGSQKEILANAEGDGSAGDEITAALFHVISALYRAVRQETIISACVLLIWVLIALIGITRAVFLMFKGGNAGTYAGRRPNSRGLPPGDKQTHGGGYELDEFFARQRVPTYEQATRDSRPSGAATVDNSANKYHGQTYTLTPNPMPKLEVQSATSPVLHTGFSPRPDLPEKLGSVNGQNIDAAIRRPTHIRASSHGDYGITSPASPHPNPDSTPYLSTSYRSRSNAAADEKHNPFADSNR